MFITQATVTIARRRIERDSQTQKWRDRQQLLELLDRATKNLKRYHSSFHSIRWNRSRSLVKQELEERLLEIAEQAHGQINAAGTLLDRIAATEQITDVYSFNQIVQLLQEAKMLVEIHHLNEEITPLDILAIEKKNPGCIPGLEGY